MQRGGWDSHRKPQDVHSWIDCPLMQRSQTAHFRLEQLPKIRMSTLHARLAAGVNRTVVLV